MGHSQLETTRSYLDEIGIDDLADVSRTGFDGDL